MWLTCLRHSLYLYNFTDSISRILYTITLRYGMVPTAATALVSLA